MGIASLVMGIVSLIISLIPIIGYIIIIPAIIGLILGIVHISKVNDKKARGIAGIVLNILALIVLVIYTIILFTSSFKKGFEKGFSEVQKSRNNVINSKENQTQSGSLSVAISKSFGTYIVPDGWSENIQLSSNKKYFYLKDGTNINTPTSNISIEEGTNRYKKEDHESFRRSILNQISMQVSGKPDESEISGSGTNTKNGDIMYIFTIEEKSTNITTKQYYIVEDYKYILIIETDFHDENIPDVSQTARSIADSFEWLK